MPVTSLPTASPQVINQINGIPVTREGALCLRPGVWLNDEDINFVLELLD